MLSINGIQYIVSSPATLVDALIDSGKLYEGFAKYYFRFAFGRIEDVSADKGLLDKMAADLKADSLQNAFINMVLHPDFAKARPAL